MSLVPRTGDLLSMLKTAEQAWKLGRAAGRAYRNRGTKRKRNSGSTKANKKGGKRQFTASWDARSARPAIKKRKRKTYRKKRSLRKRLGYVENYVKSVSAANKDVAITRAQVEGQMSCNDLVCAYQVFQCGTKADFLTALANIEARQLDAGVTTQVTTDQTVVSAPVGFKVFCSTRLKNNNQIPAQVDVYYYKSIADTADSPFAIQEDVMTTYGVSAFNTNIQWTMNCPFESNLKNFYKKLKHEKFILNAGDEISINLKSKYHRANMEEWNDRTSNSLKDISYHAVVRIQGVVCHDQTTTSLVGWNEVTLDYITMTEFFADCPGTGVKSLHTGAGADGVTTGVVSGPNVAEIQQTL